MITGSEPAYPISESEKDRLDQYPHISYPGLSIRQQFAMAAMQGLCANGTISDRNSVDEMSRLSVEFADALIESLNRTEADNV